MNGLQLIKRTALTAAIGALAFPAGAAASGIVLGQSLSPGGAGTQAGISVDGDGTAHIAWIGASSSTVLYCEIPAGATHCSSALSLPVISRAPEETISTLRIFQDANDQPLIVLGLCCGPTGEEVLKRDAAGTFQPDLLGVDTAEALDPTNVFPQDPLNPSESAENPQDYPPADEPLVDDGGVLPSVGSPEGSTGDVQFEASGVPALDVLGNSRGIAGQAKLFQIDPLGTPDGDPADPPDPVDQPDPTTGTTTDNDPAPALSDNDTPTLPTSISSGATTEPYDAAAIGRLPSGALYLLGYRRGAQGSGQAAIKVMNPGTNDLTTTFGGWRAIPAHFPATVASAASGGSWLLDATAPTTNLVLLHSEATLLLQRFQGASLQRPTAVGVLSGGIFPQPFEDPAGNLHITWLTDSRTPGCPTTDSCLAYTAVRDGRKGAVTILDTENPFNLRSYHTARTYVAANGEGDGWALAQQAMGSDRLVAYRLTLNATVSVGRGLATLHAPPSPLTGTTALVSLAVSGPRGAVKSVTFTLGSSGPARDGAAAARSSAGRAVNRIVVRHAPFNARFRLSGRHGAGRLCAQRVHETLSAQIRLAHGSRTIHDRFTWCPPLH